MEPPPQNSDIFVWLGLRCIFAGLDVCMHLRTFVNLQGLCTTRSIHIFLIRYTINKVLARQENHTVLMRHRTHVVLFRPRTHTVP